MPENGHKAGYSPGDRMPEPPAYAGEGHFPPSYASVGRSFRRSSRRSVPTSGVESDVPITPLDLGSLLGEAYSNPGRARLRPVTTEVHEDSVTPVTFSPREVTDVVDWADRLSGGTNGQHSDVAAISASPTVSSATVDRFLQTFLDTSPGSSDDGSADDDRSNPADFHVN